MRPLKQAGWVVNFVIVTIVLVAILFGGLYYLRIHRQELASTNLNGQTSSQPQRNNPSANSNKQSPSSSKENTGNGNSGSSNQTTPPKTSEPAPASTGSDGSVSDTTGNLPHTGPADSILSIGIFVLVTFFAISYLQSRRA